MTHQKIITKNPKMPLQIYFDAEEFKKIEELRNKYSFKSWAQTVRYCIKTTR